MPPDYSQMSDEELYSLAGVSPSQSAPTVAAQPTISGGYDFSRASDEELMQMAGVSPQPQQLSGSETLVGGITDLGDKMLLGAGKNVMAAGGAVTDAIFPTRDQAPDWLPDWLTGNTQSFTDNYNKYLNQAKDLTTRYQSENPVSSFINNAPALLAAPTKLGSVKGLFPKMGQAAVEGAAYGGASGFLGGEGGFENRVRSGLEGALQGEVYAPLAVGGLHLAGKGLGAAAKGASNLAAGYREASLGVKESDLIRSMKKQPIEYMDPDTGVITSFKAVSGEGYSATKAKAAEVTSKLEDQLKIINEDGFSHQQGNSGRATLTKLQARKGELRGDLDRTIDAADQLLTLKNKGTKVKLQPDWSAAENYVANESDIAHQAALEGELARTKLAWAAQPDKSIKGLIKFKRRLTSNSTWSSTADQASSTLKQKMYSGTLRAAHEAYDSVAKNTPIEKMFGEINKKLNAYISVEPMAKARAARKGGISGEVARAFTFGGVTKSLRVPGAVAMVGGVPAGVATFGAEMGARAYPATASRVADKASDILRSGASGLSSASRKFSAADYSAQKTSRPFATKATASVAPEKLLRLPAPVQKLLGNSGKGEIRALAALAGGGYVANSLISGAKENNERFGRVSGLSPAFGSISRPKSAKKNATTNGVIMSASSDKIAAKIRDSMIHQESRGNPNAVSPKGAVGLMQLMPETGKEWHKKLGITEPYNPKNPEQNKKIGTAYISWLIDQFDNDVELALTAYNQGIGRVKRLLKRVGGSSLDDIKKYLGRDGKKYAEEILSRVNDDTTMKG